MFDTLRPSQLMHKLKLFGKFTFIDRVCAGK